MPVAARHVGLIYRNEFGYKSHAPRITGSKPSKLTRDLKKEQNVSLEARDLWYLNDIVGLIKARFCAKYLEAQVLWTLKVFKIKHAKPYQVDNKNPHNAKKKLKKIPFNKSS